ncbi:hypothetical protein HDU97_007375 [Phlyctochytrium planicorne]|nr:hypothetical protein HDU97_007375 [Phlyctochytrium planicorne]
MAEHLRGEFHILSQRILPRPVSPQKTPKDQERKDEITRPPIKLILPKLVKKPTVDLQTADDGKRPGSPKESTTIKVILKRDSLQSESSAAAHAISADFKPKDKKRKRPESEQYDADARHTPPTPSKDIHQFRKVAKKETDAPLFFPENEEASSELELEMSHSDSGGGAFDDDDDWIDSDESSGRIVLTIKTSSRDPALPQTSLSDEPALKPIKLRSRKLNRERMKKGSTFRVAQVPYSQGHGDVRTLFVRFPEKDKQFQGKHVKDVHILTGADILPSPTPINDFFGCLLCSIPVKIPATVELEGAPLRWPPILEYVDEIVDSSTETGSDMYLWCFGCRFPYHSKCLGANEAKSYNDAVESVMKTLDGLSTCREEWHCPECRKSFGRRTRCSVERILTFREEIKLPSPGDSIAKREARPETNAHRMDSIERRPRRAASSKISEEVIKAESIEEDMTTATPTAEDLSKMILTDPVTFESECEAPGQIDLAASWCGPSPPERRFLVKFEGRSYWHLEWVEARWVESRWPQLANAFWSYVHAETRIVLEDTLATISPVAIATRGIGSSSRDRIPRSRRGDPKVVSRTPSLQISKMPVTSSSGTSIPNLAPLIGITSRKPFIPAPELPWPRNESQVVASIWKRIRSVGGVQLCSADTEISGFTRVFSSYALVLWNGLPNVNSTWEDWPTTPEELQMALNSDDDGLRTWALEIASFIARQQSLGYLFIENRKGFCGGPRIRHQITTRLAQELNTHISGYCDASRSISAFAEVLMENYESMPELLPAVVITDRSELSSWSASLALPLKVVEYCGDSATRKNLRTYHICSHSSNPSLLSGPVKPSYICDVIVASYDSILEDWEEFLAAIIPSPGILAVDVTLRGCGDMMLEKNFRRKKVKILVELVEVLKNVDARSRVLITDGSAYQLRQFYSSIPKEILVPTVQELFKFCDYQACHFKIHGDNVRLHNILGDKEFIPSFLNDLKACLSHLREINMGLKIAKEQMKLASNFQTSFSDFIPQSAQIAFRNFVQHINLTMNEEKRLNYIRPMRRWLEESVKGIFIKDPLSLIVKVIFVLRDWEALTEIVAELRDGGGWLAEHYLLRVHIFDSLMPLEANLVDFGSFLSFPTRSSVEEQLSVNSENPVGPGFRGCLQVAFMSPKTYQTLANNMNLANLSEEMLQLHRSNMFKLDHPEFFNIYTFFAGGIIEMVEDPRFMFLREHRLKTHLLIAGWEIDVFFGGMALFWGLRLSGYQKLNDFGWDHRFIEDEMPIDIFWDDEVGHEIDRNDTLGHEIMKSGLLNVSLDDYRRKLETMKLPKLEPRFSDFEKQAVAPALAIGDIDMRDWMKWFLGPVTARADMDVVEMIDVVISKLSNSES